MKGNKVPNIVFVAILTAMTAVFWAFFGVYRIFTNRPSPEVPRKVIEPLSPDLDRNTIDLIQKRVFFEDSQIPEIILPASPTPTPEESPNPTVKPGPST